MLSNKCIDFDICIPILLQKSKFLDNWYFVVPVTIIGGCCIISIVYAALATQPGKFKGKFVTEDLESGKGSLFFFGNFYASSLENYTKAMKKALVDVNRMDEFAILDLYFLGKGLGRKFLLLRRCYSFFLSGIIIGSFIFVVGFLIAKAELIRQAFPFLHIRTQIMHMDTSYYPNCFASLSLCVFARNNSRIQLL
jgi:hypothetical protein